MPCRRPRRLPPLRPPLSRTEKAAEAAASAGDWKTLQPLLRRQDFSRFDGAVWVAMNAAICSGQRHIIRQLAMAGFPASHANYCLLAALRSGTAATTRFILDLFTPKPIFTKEQPLHLYHEKVWLMCIATKRGNASIVQHLLDAGARVDVYDNNGSYPIHLAAEYGFVDILRILLSRGVDPNFPAKNRYRSTPLHYVARNSALGDRRARPLECAKLLLDSGARIDELEGHGSTALHTAIFWRNIDVALYLIERGASVHARVGAGYTPVSLAALYGKPSRFDASLWPVVEACLQHGASCHVRNRFGEPALLHAVQDWRILKVLLQAGANPNARDRQGTTALHVAAEKGYFESTRLLLKYGANVDAKDKRGRTPEVIAYKFKQYDVHRILFRASLSKCFAKP